MNSDAYDVALIDLLGKIVQGIVSNPNNAYMHEFEIKNRAEQIFGQVRNIYLPSISYSVGAGGYTYPPQGTAPVYTPTNYEIGGNG